MRGLQTLRFLSAAAIGCALAACGAGGTNTSLPPSSGDGGGASAHLAKATIRIVIPARKSRQKILFRGHYVSPATQSIAIAVTPNGGGATHTFNANLTPASNSNCTASLICTITIGLPPGSYTAALSTYDGLLGGNGNPTGNELSADQSVPFTFVAGKNNAVNITLDGIPASVAVLPLDSTLSGDPTSGYTISKCFSSAKVEVLGLDADNNAIVGPGAPTPTLASSDTTHLAVATPAPSSPNAFTLSRPSVPNADAVVQLTASITPAAGSGGSSQSAQVNVTFNTDICGVITEYSIPTSESIPQGITAGSDGALWFTESNGDVNKIGRITTGGTITEYSLPASNDNPEVITAGSDGALWFTEPPSVSNNVARITTGGSITTNTVPTNDSRPQGITSGSDGALWFTESAVSKIGRITTGGAFAEYSVPTSNSVPYGITAGPDSALWFTENSGDKIGRITTGGTITEFSIPTSNSSPQIITAGPDGALWFTEYSANKIGRVTTSGTFTEFSIPTSVSEPRGIVAGLDGALWFAETNGGKIGRITTGGTITEFSIPASYSFPQYITSGPDGALWFTDQGNKIGRLQ